MNRAYLSPATHGGYDPRDAGQSEPVIKDCRDLTALNYDLKTSFGPCLVPRMVIPGWIMPVTRVP